MKESILEMRVRHMLNHNRFPDPVAEYRFHPIRKWRFDFAYVNQKIAIECEGGIWNGGRHSRGVGLTQDCEKYNCATLMDWKVLRYTTNTIYNIPDDLRKIWKGE